MVKRLLLLAIALIASLGASAPAAARDLSGAFCHALTPIGAAPPPAAAYRCGGKPAEPAHRRLWVWIDARAIPPGASTLLLHQTRFDRLTVDFIYADGASRTESVARGAYGDRWRIGAQVVFDAPRHDVPLAGVRLHVDNLALYSLLRVRALTPEAAGRDASLGGALVGGVLVLLAVSMLYNLGLAVSTRRAFFLFHALWAASLLVWGSLWSQLALLAAPAVAGTLSSQLCSTLSGVAVVFATGCAIACLRPGDVPRWARTLLIALGIVVFALSIPLGFGPERGLPALIPVIGYCILALLAGVVVALGIAWARGNRDARDFVLAWAVPMGMLAAQQFVSFGSSLFGGGAQIAILIAGAVQTVWLSAVTSLRLARLRIERDAALAAEAELKLLAERDPLTELFNRRGFVPRADAMAREASERDDSFGLILLDIDHFKAVNDRRGHDRGDAVLRTLARELKLAAEPFGHSGRLGGEEFAVAIRGMTRPALLRFAEHLRATLAAIDHGGFFVTVSIGITEAAGDDDAGFAELYHAADQALYAAKHGGRNRTAYARGGAVFVMSPGEHVAA